MASAIRAKFSWARNSISSLAERHSKPHPFRGVRLFLATLNFARAMKWLIASAIVLGFLIGLPSAFASTQAEQLFDRASNALSTGNYDAAESGFRQVLKLEPGNLGALGNLGVVYSRTHRYSKAIKVYDRALRISPRDAGLLLNLGLVYLKQDNYAQARPLFQKLHAQTPDDAKATNLLATCLVFGGQAAEAIGLLKPIVSRNPDPSSVYLLGIAYSKAGQSEAG